MPSITIVTRKSPLALWQAEFVKKQLKHHHPELDVQIKGITTSGDNWLQTPLYQIGGKSLFVKELEEALLSLDADIAVHSLKDIPVDLPEGLLLGAICERESPFDAWICPKGLSLMDLPPNSVIGTSSLRRQAQLGALRKDLVYKPLRGNVGTRLEKCLNGEWDAIVLAEAGLSRLGLQQHITHVFSENEMIPAVAQGALGIECRVNDEKTQALLKALHHAPTEKAVFAERAMNRALGGSCHVPVAGFAKWENKELHLTGRVGDLSTYSLIEAHARHKGDDPEALGNTVAQMLVAKGAKEFIQRSMPS